MVVVSCPSTCRAAVLEVLGGRPITVSSLDELEKRLNVATCAVVVLEGVAEEQALARIDALVGSRRNPPFVVVLPLSTANAEVISRLGGVRFVWTHQVRSNLVPVVSGARRDPWVQRLHDEIQRTHLRSQVLKPALMRAVLADPPPASRKAFLRLTGLRLGALKYHWGEIRGRGGVSLKCFLTHLMLFHATVLRQSGWRPGDVARGLDIDERTLRRMASREWSADPESCRRITPASAMRLVLACLGGAT